jgi:hypothetical protein
LLYDGCKAKLVTGVIAGLMQGRTGVFAEWMQGRHLYVLGYLASVFGNSVSMFIVTLGLSGYSNGYGNYPRQKLSWVQYLDKSSKGKAYEN